MKKILLASTAVFAVSGAAAFAQVSDGISISGSAEMGVIGGELATTNAAGNKATETVPLQFFNDLDIAFKLSGTTDGGVAFGANVDLDEAGKLGNELGNQGTSVFVSSDFGRVTLGDTDGAVDFVIGDAGSYGNPGSINDAETGHLGYLGSWLDGSGDNQVVRYDYTFDAFTIAVSIEQQPSGDDGTVVDGDEDITWGIGGRYNFAFGGGSANVALGYQTSPDASITIGGDASSQEVNLTLGTGETQAIAVGLGGSLDSGITGGITYTNFDIEDEDPVNHFGLGVGYAFDALSLHGNYGLYTGGDIEANIQGFGLAAGYDLGGGASLLAAYGRTDATNDTDDREIVIDDYSIGLSFSF